MKQLRFPDELSETHLFDQIGTHEHIGYDMENEKGCFVQIEGGVFVPIDFWRHAPNRFSDSCKASLSESIYLLKEKYPSTKFYIFSTGKQLLKWLAE